jgi:trk system potassium uptake protein TrkH
LFVGSFLLLIAAGTLGLELLPGLYTGERLGWLDALFTSTSAVCVTGLIVVDTATYFTPAGQAWILLLIQLGGLGIITFTSLIVAMLGRRLSLEHEAISASIADIAPHVDYRVLTRDVVLFTLAIEASGALALTLLWLPRLGPSAAWHGAFHSVSAFCNAGFSTFTDNLIGFQRSPATLLVVGGLIVAGGIGFLTMEESYRWLRARWGRRRFRVSLQSRLILLTTALLIAVGWGTFAALEWDRTLKGLPAADKLANGLFLSITPRTAGFNAIDYGRASDSANFQTILLMTVGGSPGSTAGGLKTTTAALLVLLAAARFRGRSTTDLWGRTIPEESIQRAVGLSIASFALVTACILVITTAESGGPGSAVRDSFLKYMFEAVSAFNTVGLSMGVTAGLTAASKWTLIVLMFVGRVGLTTAAAALVLARPGSGGEFRFAYEDVVVG